MELGRLRIRSRVRLVIIGHRVQREARVFLRLERLDFLDLFPWSSAYRSPVALFAATRASRHDGRLRLAEALREASLQPEGFAANYDQAVDVVTRRLESGLSPTCAGRLRELLTAAAATAEEEPQAMAMQCAGPRRASGTTAGDLGETIGPACWR